MPRTSHQERAGWARALKDRTSAVPAALGDIRQLRELCCVTVSRPPEQAAAPPGCSAVAPQSLVPGASGTALPGLLRDVAVTGWW